MKAQDTDSIDRYIKNKMDAAEKTAFEVAMESDRSLQSEVLFRQDLQRTLQWKRQIVKAHTAMVANLQTAQIDTYVKDKIDPSDKVAFETTVQQDADLQSEVLFRQELRRTLQWKQQIKIAHQQMLAQQKTSIPALQSVTTVNNKTVPITKRFSLRRVLSYAAMLIPGMAIGWLIAMGGPTPQPASTNTYGGSAEEAVTLYDKESTLVKVAQEEALAVTTTTSRLQIIITEMDNPTERYLLTDDFLEVIFDKQVLADMPLEGQAVSFILEKLETPKLQVGLLQINQQTYAIPLSDKDFNQLFAK